MSRSDCDSDGFESAEDDDFEPIKTTTATTTTTIKSTASAATESQLKTDLITKSAAKERDEKAKTLDKLKALDVNDEKTAGENDDWGWDENDDWAASDDPKNRNSSGAAAATTTTATASQPQPAASKHGRNNASANTQSPSPLAAAQAQRHDDRVQSQPETPSNAWSPWSGMVSLLSTASTNVASFTSHVSSVIESNIGIPDPEKFAQQQSHDNDKLETASQNSDDSKCSNSTSKSKSTEKQQQPRQPLQPPSEETLLNLGSFVSNVTSISNRVIAGGLDTLEGIGKKTMTIIQENDAGLISKRKLLGLDNQKPVLSQVLREAKEKSEESEKTMKLTQKKLYKKQLHFETLFDDYHGLVHLEALEMLSKQASLKLQALLMPLSGIALNELQQTMSSVSELCELNELDQEDSPTHLYDVAELEEKLKSATEDFDIPIDFTDILE